METETRRPPAPRPLNGQECRALIARNYLAIVATVGEGQPYAIPLIYGFQSDQFFFVTGEGRKTRNMEEQPLVCLTIVETEEHAKKWQSVLVFGLVSWLTDDESVKHALAVMRDQYPGVSTRSSAGPAALAQAGYRVGMVEIQRMSGRAQGY